MAEIVSAGLIHNLLFLQNLKPAKALGMTTVWVDNGSERGAHLAEDGHVDFVIADVGDWLEAILGDDNDH